MPATGRSPTTSPLDGRAPFGLDEGAPSRLEPRERRAWFERALAGADALISDLPALRARIAEELELERAALHAQGPPSA